jgi:F0F1-type ATP synthase delta subunit
MKYAPQLYAKAFAKTARAAHAAEKQEALAKRLVEIVVKNGDGHQLKKIAAYAEKIIREETGKRKVVVESARPLKQPLAKLLKNFAHHSDIIESKIDPYLVAGIKITVNDEEQLDGSLKRKLDKLFRN